MSYFSDEDDPDVYESSSEEWSSSSEPKKRRSTRQTIPKTNKKAKVINNEKKDGSSGNQKQLKNNKNKKSKTNSTKNVKNIVTEGYSTGSFLILKKDAQVGDPKKPPCLWRIDGKALLQKYEPFEEDGKVLHRTTSVYTGWSALDKDQYAPITLRSVSQKNHIKVVELEWDKLKEVNMDSD